MQLTLTAKSAVFQSGRHASLVSVYLKSLLRIFAAGYCFRYLKFFTPILLQYLNILHLLHQGDMDAQIFCPYATRRSL